MNHAIESEMQKPSAEKSTTYCHSVFSCQRRATHEVRVGEVGIGGNNPIRIQSMTISDTLDTEATVREVTALAEAGCEIVRITAPSIREAENLRAIRDALRRQGVRVPLVADIHFTPNAAMVAADIVDKVRINPGNYADKKKFEVRDYSDAEYAAELERIYERFSPLVKKCRENGVAMRIGVNHGSLSDRVMNRYGDTPEGMVESALEFIRICEDHSYRDIIVSMKSSNPQVMIQAYRLLAARMSELGMTYPFHLGVTEAGDGEDGRVKSAVGIGALLEDGIGDTIRVSLTEDAIHEIPVARALVAKYNAGMALPPVSPEPGNDAWLHHFDPFHPERRRTAHVEVPGADAGGGAPVRVAIAAGSLQFRSSGLRVFSPNQDEQKPEWIFLDNQKETPEPYQSLTPISPFATDQGVVHCPLSAADAHPVIDRKVSSSFARAREFGAAVLCSVHDISLPDYSPQWLEDALHRVAAERAREPRVPLLMGVRMPEKCLGGLGRVRLFLLEYARHHFSAPLVLMYRVAPDYAGWQLDASATLGALMCDGFGDAVLIDGDVAPEDATRFAYTLLQATRLRISKTEFISCPSCGRTLFDLQSTTERIKSKTGHLKGVKIAVMGCIVNGPGEMADADFGYVGAGHKKVDLFVGKERVEKNIPEQEADQRLIALIKRHGKWVEPPVAQD